MEWTVPWDIVGRLVVAATLGAIIGLERELTDHSAGFRTLMTVALGAAVFGAISTIGFEEIQAERASTNLQADVTRVASQVVVGIGFLGAGLIFRRGDTVVNLTTAASLWGTAAVGLAAGVGNVGMAVVTTIIIAIALLVLPIPQRAIVARFGREKRHLCITPSDGTTIGDLRAHVETLDGVSIDRWRVEKHHGDLRIRCHLTGGGETDLEALLAELAQSGSVADLRSE